MICFIALLIFGILGIFSARHRKIALEAFDCVFRRITLRKCTTGLDVRLKSKISGRFLQKNPRLGKFVYKHFEMISWIFTILLIGSLVWTGISGYNYYVYGNCNGPSIEDQEGLCLFDPTGEHAQITTCSNEDIDIQTAGTQPTLKEIDLSLFPAYKPKEIKNTLVYVGCYTCPNTRKVNPTINELVVKNKDSLEFVFIHLPLSKEQEYIYKIENCLFQENKVAFWKFHNKLMQMTIEKVKAQEKVISLLENIEEVDAEKITFCSETIQANELLEKQIAEINKMNVEGTPTIFVSNFNNHDEQVFIGPKPLRVYERQLSTHTDWFGISLAGLGGVMLLTILYFMIFKRK